MENENSITAGYGLSIDKSLYCPNSISFSITNENPVEYIRLTKDGFYWKGKLVEEDKEIYNRFKEWLDLAHSKLM